MKPEVFEGAFRGPYHSCACYHSCSCPPRRTRSRFMSATTLSRLEMSALCGVARVENILWHARRHRHRHRHTGERWALLQRGGAALTAHTALHTARR